jgi:hypothetical protein
MIELAQMQSANAALRADFVGRDWYSLCADFDINPDALRFVAAQMENHAESAFITGFLLGMKLAKGDPR